MYNVIPTEKYSNVADEMSKAKQSKAEQSKAKQSKGRSKDTKVRFGDGLGDAVG